MDGGFEGEVTFRDLAFINPMAAANGACHGRGGGIDLPDIDDDTPEKSEALLIKMLRIWVRYFNGFPDFGEGDLR
jgi:hypothetical protein